MNRFDPMSRARARRAPWWLFLILAFLVPIIIAVVQIMAVLYKFTGNTTGDTVYSGDLGLGVSGFFFFGFVIVALFVYTNQPRVRRENLGLDGWNYIKGAPMWAGGRYQAFPLHTTDALHTTDYAWGTINGLTASAYTAWPTDKYRYSIESIELVGATPALAFTNAGLTDALANLVGGQDYDTESAAFNERWRVQTTNPAFASAFLNPTNIERLLDPDIEGFNFVIDAGSIYCWTPGLVELGGIEPRLRALAELAGRVPEHVYAQYGTPRDDAWGPATRAIAPLETAEPRQVWLPEGDSRLPLSPSPKKE